MNFFRAQDDARRKTWLLGSLMVAALTILIVCTALLVNVVFLVGAMTDDHGLRATIPGYLSLGQLLSINPRSFVISTAIVVVTVGLACAYKFTQVRSGGRAVAESLNGRLVPADSQDPGERQLINVVEEMAIASGVPVPPVYLLDESALNAFAAGYSYDDAVIGVTAGCLRRLTRDELQGVIAHEFSHILNGDIRINQRLVVMLHGIVFLGLLGRRVIRQRSFQPLGLGLMAVGFLGTAMGAVIKAAISRQREFLADAAAVQFTRNPNGIGNALKKIGATSGGAQLSNVTASEHSHMFFSQAVGVMFKSLMATHPPLAARIKAINPYWNGRYPVLDEPARLGTSTPTERELTVAFANADDYGTAATATIESASADARIADLVGRPNRSNLETAGAIIGTMDKVCLNAAHEPWSACALVYALLLGQDEALQHRQLNLIGDSAMSTQTLALYHHTSKLSAHHKLALLEISGAAFKQMSRRQLTNLMTTASSLVKADNVISLFEWVMMRLLEKSVSDPSTTATSKRAKRLSTDETNAFATILVRYLAHYGHELAERREAAFAAGCSELGVTSKYRSVNHGDFGALNTAINRLRLLKPLEKPRLLKACAKTALYDGVVSNNQTALLQAFSAALDCPLPPTVVAPILIPSNAVNRSEETQRRA